MMKTIDLNKTVYELCSEYPEVQEILIKLGFKDLATPSMLKTVGKFMILPKGAAMKRIELELIKETFRKEGYEVKE